VFPRVISISCQLLNCAFDWIKYSYILVLNQLSNRHLLFKKLLLINKDSNRMSLTRIHLRMNKVDLELEHFMKSMECDCHKYKRNNIKWLLYAGGWVRWRWLLVRVAGYLSGKTNDPHNFFLGMLQLRGKEPTKDHNR
jgi:hypothetical protein